MDYKESHGQIMSSQDKSKYTKLLAYLATLPLHPKVIEHRGIAASFGVVNYRPIFKADAERRLLMAIANEPNTAATISKLTGITHKYVCQLKRALEAQGRIEVIGLCQCPTTGSRNVQLLALTKPWT